MRDWLVRKWEETWNPKADLGKVSLTKLYDLNAAMRRNWWYDKKGQRWPLKEAL